MIRDVRCPLCNSLLGGIEAVGSPVRFFCDKPGCKAEVFISKRRFPSDNGLNELARIIGARERMVKGAL